MSTWRRAALSVRAYVYKCIYYIYIYVYTYAIIMEWDLSVSERVIRWLRLKIYVLPYTVSNRPTLVRHKQITRAHAQPWFPWDNALVTGRELARGAEARKDRSVCYIILYYIILYYIYARWLTWRTHARVG